MIKTFGTGIRRYTNSKTKPSFTVTENVIKVIIPLLKDNMDMTQDEIAVYGVLNKNINKPISEIMISPGIEFGKSKVTEQLIAYRYSLNVRGMKDMPLVIKSITV